MNLVKPDSNMSSDREEGEARLKHIIAEYRAANGLRELTEDGSTYADGLGLKDEMLKRKMSSKQIRGISLRRTHDEYDSGPSFPLLRSAHSASE